jgi:hypothetical protein
MGKKTLGEACTRTDQCASMLHCLEGSCRSPTPASNGDPHDARDAGDADADAEAGFPIGADLQSE